MYRKILYIGLGLGLVLGTAAIAYAAPSTQNFQNIQPFTTNTYDNGTAANEWFHTFTKYASTTAISASNLSTGNCILVAAGGELGSSIAPCVLTNRALTINGTANQISRDIGQQDLSADRVWVLSLPPLVIFPGNASSTEFSNFGMAYFGGTSTSTFGGNGQFHHVPSIAADIPYASTTEITATTASSTNLIVSSAGGTAGCATFASNGTISNVGSPCAASGASPYSFTPSVNIGQQVSATGTMISDSAGFAASSTSAFTGISNYGYAVATSTTVCARGCQYTDIQTAINDGWNAIYLKAETYTLTSHLQIPNRNNFIMIGQGQRTLIQFNKTSVGLGMMLADPTVAVTGDLFQDFAFQGTGAGNLGTCIDFSHMEITKFIHVDCLTTLNGYIASSSLSSFYDIIDSPTIKIAGGAGGGLDSVGIGLFSNAAIETTIINPRIQPNGGGDINSTGIYLNSHSVTCIKCEVESNFLYGMYVDQDGSDLNANVYLEGNQTGIHFEPSDAAVGGYNITGNISDPNAGNQNIDDGGAVGLCVNARVQFAAVNYCTNVKQGFGTNSPTSVLEVSSNNNGSTPGISNGTLGLLGSFGPGITLTKGASQRIIVNSLFSETTGALDFVLSTTTFTGGENQGVRMTTGNAIGTNDVLVQPIVDANGYAIFEGYSSSSVTTATAGTAISSRNSPVLLAPNRNEVLRATTNGRIGIGTTTPAATLGIQGNQFIAGNIVSTSTTASIFPNASTTALSASELCLTTCISSFAGGGASTTLLIDNNTFTGINSWANIASTSIMGPLAIGSTTPAGGAELDVNGNVGIPITKAVLFNDSSGGVGNFGGLIAVGYNFTSTGITKSLVTGNSINFLMRTNTASQGFTFDGTSGNSIAEFRNDGKTYFRQNMSVGTTTLTNPMGMLNVASTTAPQLDLLSGSNSAAWTFRNEAGGRFDISTSTLSGATTSISALWFDTNGVWNTGNIVNCNGATNALGVTANAIGCDSGVSDARLKKDITPISTGLATVMKLDPVTFFWKDLSNHNTQSPLMQYGFTAQSIQPILPSAVGSSPDGYLTLDKTALIAPIVSAIQDIEKQIQTILARLDGDETKINHLQAEIDAINAKIK